MKRFTYLLLLIAIPALAVPPVDKPLKIGFVNYEYVRSQVNEAKKVAEELEASKRQILETLQKEHAAFQEKWSKVQQSLPKLSEDERMKKQNEYMTEAASFEKKREEKENAFKVEETNKWQGIEAKATAVLDDIIKEKKYNVVLQSFVIAGADAEFKKSEDVSAELIERYNKKHPLPKEAPKKAPAKK